MAREHERVGFRKDDDPDVGSEYEWVETFMGKTMDLAGVMTAWDPPNRFVWSPIAGPYEMSGGWAFEVDGTQTKVTRFSDSELTGFMRLAAGLMGPLAKRQVRRELQALKELIEAQTGG